MGNSYVPEWVNSATAERLLSMSRQTLKRKRDIAPNGFLINGVPEGKWISYYDNGQILEEVNYRKGYYDGQNITYHSNGEIKSKGLWSNGKKHNIWTWYHQNGQLHEELSFKDGEISW